MWQVDINATCDDTVHLIDKVKTPRIGKWIQQKGGGYKCSYCGCFSLDRIDGKWVYVSERTRICPYCKANMR